MIWEGAFTHFLTFVSFKIQLEKFTGDPSLTRFTLEALAVGADLVLDCGHCVCVHACVCVQMCACGASRVCMSARMYTLVRVRANAARLSYFQVHVSLRGTN